MTTITAAQQDALDGVAWTADAACVTRPDLPWTTDTTRLPRHTVTAMGRVCRACPVRSDCAAHADAIDATGGFWAGSDRAVEQLPLFPAAFPTSAPASRARVVRRSA